MKNKAALFLAVLWTGAVLSSCARSHYYRGRLKEESGDVLRAAQQYESYLSHSPSGRYAEETNVRLGNIYASLNRCLEAQHHYEAALRLADLSRANLSLPWKLQAQEGLLDCPDYFPLGEVRQWVYGDSASLGRNMTLNWQLGLSTAGSPDQIQSFLYAGKNLVKQGNVSYAKKDWAVWEQNGGEMIPILRYPFDPGRQWVVNFSSAIYVYRIESNTAQVKTAAGTFSGCLKVRETNKKFTGSWEYVYYAPSIGRIKTSIAGPGFENPNTELIRYKSANSPVP